MSQSKQVPEYIFKVKTKEAHVIKLLGELLSNTIHPKHAPFKINEQGIFLTQADPGEEQLIDICLNKENFQFYRCTKSLSFSVNSNILFKMLRSIKKKDSITLFITEAEPLKLGFCVEQADENPKTNTTICITYNRPEQYELPSNYDNPVIMTSKEFQKMKNLTSIAKTVKVTSKPGYIRFFCEGGHLLSRELVCGDENESPDCEPNIQNFTTNYITGLAKCAAASQNGNIYIFNSPTEPMKIKMRAGNLGDLTIYIKSKEMVEWEGDPPKETEQESE
jgi:proliferating cell nuclear antigen PCNA